MNVLNGQHSKQKQKFDADLHEGEHKAQLVDPLAAKQEDGFAIMTTPPSEITMATTTILHQRQAHRVQHSTLDLAGMIACCR